MEGNGTVPTVIVRRYIGLWPGQTCERAMSHASLSQQYWRVASLRGAAAGPVDGSREPQLILRGTELGYRADAGCGRLAGEYRVEGTRIRFEAPATTPACPTALREQQATLLGALEDARAWRIQGQVLELFDAAGQPLAVLEAVYLR
jgi:heat shock protein HslJ